MYIKLSMNIHKKVYNKYIISIEYNIKDISIHNINKFLRQVS